MAAWERNGIERMRRNPWWLLVGASPILVALGSLFGALATGDAGFLAPVFHLVVFGLLGTYFAHTFNKNPRFASGRLTIDEHTIRHAEPYMRPLVCARSEITSGLVVPSEDGREWLVRLQRKGARATVNLRVQSEEEGREVLVALGLDATQSVARVRGMSPYFGLTGDKLLAASLLPPVVGVAAIASAVAMGGPVTAVAVAVFSLTMLAVITTMTVRMRISIGADGIHTRWLGVEQFHPFSELREVVSVERALITKSYLGVELRKLDGSTTFLPIGQRRWVEEDFRATVERIREALDVYRAGSGADAARVVERGARTAREWVSALRRIGTGADADMRTAPVDASALSRIVGDPRAKPSARASAAIALATAEDAPAHRVRIRAAAEAAAAPKLRIALQKVATEDASEDELAELLAELEAEEDAKRARR